MHRCGGTSGRAAGGGTTGSRRPGSWQALAPTHRQRAQEQSAHCRRGWGGAQGRQISVIQREAAVPPPPRWPPAPPACRRRSASSRKHSPDAPQHNAAQQGAEEQRAPHGVRRAGVSKLARVCKPPERSERMVMEAPQRPL